MLVLSGVDFYNADQQLRLVAMLTGTPANIASVMDWEDNYFKQHETGVPNIGKRPAKDHVHVGMHARSRRGCQKW